MVYYIRSSEVTLALFLLGPAYVEKKEERLFYPWINVLMKSAIWHRTAQKKEIIKAYRKLAQQWHPDNFQDPEEKKKAEKKFIDIAQAKEVLTDPGKECVWSAEPVGSCYCQSLSKCQASEGLLWTAHYSLFCPNSLRPSLFSWAPFPVQWNGFIWTILQNHFDHWETRQS